MIAPTIRQDVYQPTIYASNPCQQFVLIANRTTAALHKQD